METFRRGYEYIGVLIRIHTYCKEAHNRLFSTFARDEKHTKGQDTVRYKRDQTMNASALGSRSLRRRPVGKPPYL